ncbi:putative hydrolase of HD superfamily [Sphingomonas sp. UYAg733]
MTDQTPLVRQIAFLTEIDALKSVMRQSPLIDRSRRENSAEHSWHLALFALVLAEGEPGVDAATVIRMLLIHDIVEIDAGDAPIHGTHDLDALALAERAAAARIFGLLPDAQRDAMLALWSEFEAGETANARFAKGLDRLQPLLLNTLTGGGTWTENGVSEAQVMARYGPVIERGSPRLWDHARVLVERFFRSVTGRADR